ncbi:hypothetical protein FF38_07709 [Lucilia cuprina]|uniref:Uncharacterized protein n=1 Tax=Lucilia cuprina TaxID=7375 RepID=A0A0L0BKZ6_LUCCU|nr:hypothetical protein FF38_07709 [Lucilia cuprina]
MYLEELVDKRNKVCRQQATEKHKIKCQKDFYSPSPRANHFHHSSQASQPTIKRLIKCYLCWTNTARQAIESESQRNCPNFVIVLNLGFNQNRMNFRPNTNTPRQTNFLKIHSTEFTLQFAIKSIKGYCIDSPKKIVGTSTSLSVTFKYPCSLVTQAELQKDAKVSTNY